MHKKSKLLKKYFLVASAFFLFLISFILLTDTKNHLKKWLIINSIEEMYNRADLSQCSLFVGGFINFGYWPDQISNSLLSTEERLESEKNLYRYVLNKINVNKEDEVLEIACGLGLGSALTLEEFTPKKMDGIDVSAAQIERAKQVNQQLIELNKDHLAFQKGAAETIPFEANNFDKIFSIEAAQHFSSLEKFSKESYRVLKPNGTLAIATFFGTSDQSEKQMSDMIPTVKNGI